MQGPECENVLGPSRERQRMTWEGWEVAVACPKDGEAWLTSLHSIYLPR